METGHLHIQVKRQDGLGSWKVLLEDLQRRQQSARGPQVILGRRGESIQDLSTVMNLANGLPVS